MKPLYPFRRTCKESAALLVAREDRPLPLSDEVGLRLHLAICKGCQPLAGQMKMISSAMAQWRNQQNRS